MKGKFSEHGLIVSALEYVIDIKEVYSNICMKIHISSKQTQYLINIFKMRFVMRNYLKNAQQCLNGIFKKTCWATTVPYSVMWISPFMYTMEVWGNHLIPDAKKHAWWPFYLLNSK